MFYSLFNGLELHVTTVLRLLKMVLSPKTSDES